MEKIEGTNIGSALSSPAGPSDLRQPWVTPVVTPHPIRPTTGTPADVSVEAHLASVSVSVNS